MWPDGSIDEISFELEMPMTNCVVRFLDLSVRWIRDDLQLVRSTNQIILLLHFFLAGAMNRPA